MVGLLAHLYPDIKPQMVSELNSLLPGVIGNGSGHIPLKTIEDYSGRGSASSVWPRCSTPGSAGCPGCGSRSR